MEKSKLIFSSNSPKCMVRKGEAKQSKENLKLRLPCFSVIFPRYVGDSFMH